MASSSLLDTPTHQLSQRRARPEAITDGPFPSIEVGQTRIWNTHGPRLDPWLLAKHRRHVLLHATDRPLLDGLIAQRRISVEVAKAEQLRATLPPHGLASWASRSN